MPLSEMKVNKKDITGLVVLITIFPDMVADEMNNRRVKTNVTIPAWLKELAEKRDDVNLSKILEIALMDYLGINSKVLQ